MASGSPDETAADRSMLAIPLAELTRLVIRNPVTVIVLGLLLAAVSVLGTAKSLGFKTSRLDLINPNSNYNQLWLEYLEQFGADDDVVVVVEGDDKDDVSPVLEALYSRLSANRESFYAVLHERGLANVRAKALHYVPPDELAEMEGKLVGLEPVLNGNWEAISFDRLLWGANQRLLIDSPQQKQAAAAEMNRLADGLLHALREDGDDASIWDEPNESLSVMSQLDSEYFTANEGRMGFVLLRLVKNESSFSQGGEAIRRLRGIIRNVQDDHPEVRIGLTGLPVMENDEMEGSQKDMILSSVLSLVGVAVLFIAGFGGLRHPLLAVGTLIVGLAWSFGFVTVSIGHLNILSVSFGVILIGLGIDFGIHYVAKYLQLREKIGDSGEALIETSRSVGPGIVTGAATTSIAFFTAALTEFTGVAELGVIAGGGILVCLVGAFTLLPAMIVLGDRSRNRYLMPHPLRIDGWIAPMMQAPRATLLGSLVFCLFLATGASKLYYDHNLLNLQAQDLESVEWEKKLLEETDRSVWFALSIASSRQELIARKETFEKLSHVDHVEEIASLLPPDDESRSAQILRIRNRLTNLPEYPPTLPIAPAPQLAQVLAQSQQLLPADDATAMQARRRISQARELLRTMPQAHYEAIMRSLQQRSAGEMLTQMHSLYAVSDPTTPNVDDFPEALVTRFVGKNNQYLLRIYPNGDIWDMESLADFVEEVQSVDAQVTGQPLQTYYASRQMQKSYIHAAIYSLLAVLMVLILDFRSLRHSLLALTPVGFGSAMLFGIQGFMDIPLNPANMIVLPLILGIGIDDGVHVLHDFRCQSGRRYRISASTATAVLITSLTTMIGFGSLMLADHQGLQSLGRVLTIGVTCCLFTSLILLPAFLSTITGNRKIEEPPRKPKPEATRKRIRPGIFDPIGKEAVVSQETRQSEPFSGTDPEESPKSGASGVVSSDKSLIVPVRRSP
ncbi:MMPL family transporter [Blastopirellula retiformator]|uniref:Membrane transport protein mmpL8 n=1 Tax=Blastopirellula retiformator TaxID=2527970 RepID=A0A5C5VM99_9BACT|nr:MMPL family transporter [Blastopirellula retiformator]TWT39177.1 Membrane transport protein mmpL8 [Blastopirellula retiformator]